MKIMKFLFLGICLLLLQTCISYKQEPTPVAAAVPAPAIASTVVTPLVPPVGAPAVPAKPEIANQTAVNLTGAQLAAYPNVYEAPTQTNQLGKNNALVTRLSGALSEANPQMNLRLTQFLEAMKYGLHQLTKGEAEQIFYFVDADKKDTVSQKEWQDFVALFVLPFEACDKDNNKVLNEEEFKICFDNDPRTRFIEFRKRYDTSKYGLIMDTISTRGKREINFADYLFVRKVLYGWKECHSHSTYIAKAHFACALNKAIPNKFNLKLDIEKMYNTGLELAADRNLIELDFIAYLRISYFAYVFTVFATPQDTPYLEKTQWLEAVKQDRLPNNFEEAEINYIYELINTNPLKPVTTIDFTSFVFFFNLHKLFYTYSATKPLQLSRDEFLKMLDDPFVNKEIVMAIDGSATKFTEPQYQEASLILNRVRLNESQFFKFKQDSSVTTGLTKNDKTTLANYYDIVPNKVNREIFFTSIADNDKQFILKSHLYKGFQLANLYTSVLGSCTKTRPIPVTWFIEKLPTLYDTVTPPISMKQRNNLSYYKSLPGELYLDLLTFIALEKFNDKIKVYTMSDAMLVNETVLKTILQDFGMENIPDTVLDTASQQMDTLRRRQFEPRKIIISCIIVQAAGSENVRNLLTVEKEGLRHNLDPARPFPALLTRRQSLSPGV
jgi:hypothetical protein